MRSAFAVTLLGVIASWLPAPTSAQARAERERGPVTQLERPNAPSTVTPTLLSLAIPGAGQHVLGQRRKWVYLAVEIAGWALWAERRAAASDYRDRYRDYAWETARLQGAARVDGDFDYYERMTKWVRSGAFDSDPGSSGVQPELDPSTYNGSIWSLAAQIYLPAGPIPPPTDPAYQNALAYYEQRAYGSALLWDWTAAPGGQQELARLIEESDDRFGQATTVLGAVIANHMLSAADAYLSARAGAEARLRLWPAGGWGPFGVVSGASADGLTRQDGLTSRWMTGQPGADWVLVLSLGVGR